MAPAANKAPTGKHVKKTAAKKSPVAKKAPVAKETPTGTVVKKAAVKKAPAAKMKSAPKPRDISAEEHYKMIETAAYFRAESDGWQGHPSAYWSAAEAEIAALLSK
jgi:hypothetical protein